MSTFSHFIILQQFKTIPGEFLYQVLYVSLETLFSFEVIHSLTKLFCDVST